MGGKTVRQGRRTLRVITAEGMASAVMVGTGETYVAAFVLALGFGRVVAGLVASVPLLAGATI